MLLVIVTDTFVLQMVKQVLCNDTFNIAEWFIERKVKNGLAELNERRRIKVKTIHPLRRYAPRPTCLRGTIGWRSEILL